MSRGAMSAEPEARAASAHSRVSGAERWLVKTSNVGTLQRITASVSRIAVR